MSYAPHHPRRSDRRSKANLPDTYGSSRNLSVHVLEGSGMTLSCDPRSGVYGATFASVPTAGYLSAYCQGVESALSGNPPDSRTSGSHSSYDTTHHMGALPTVRNGHTESRQPAPRSYDPSPSAHAPRSEVDERPRRRYRHAKPREDDPDRHDRLAKKYAPLQAAGAAQEQNDQGPYGEQPFDPYSHYQGSVGSPPTGQSFHQGNHPGVNDGSSNVYYEDQEGPEPLAPQDWYQDVNGEWKTYPVQPGYDAEAEHPPKTGSGYSNQETGPYYWT